MAATPVQAVQDEQKNPLAPDAVIRTNHWVRPVLKDGRIILVVKKDGSGYYIENNKRKEEG